MNNDISSNFLTCTSCKHKLCKLILCETYLYEIYIGDTINPVYYLPSIVY